MTKIGRVLDKLAIGEFLVVVKMRSDPLFSLSLRDEKELTTVPNQLTTVLSLPTLCNQLKMMSQQIQPI